MLKKRVITALWGVALVFAVTWFGEPWFTILVVIVGLLAAFEFYKMVATSRVSPLTYFGLFCTAIIIISRNPDWLSLLESRFKLDLFTPLLLTSAVALSLIWLLLRPQKEQAFTRWAWTVAGIFYVGWLLGYLVALRGMDYGREWVLLALFTTFGSDTAAFFTGRALGRHRLAPNISPGKTWEGTIGGILGAIIVSLIVVIIFDLPVNYGQAVLLGLLLSIFGQLGDLVESLLKRNMGVKDSGKLLAGHGGMLDRIDSVAFATIVTYYFALSLGGWQA